MLKIIEDYPPVESLPPGDYITHFQLGIGTVGEGEAQWLVLVSDDRGQKFGLYRARAAMVKPGDTVTITRR